MNSSSKPYFRNLDALRFIAAIGFFMHSFTIRIPGVNYPSWMVNVSHFANNGSLCVNVLHVLSGFLITFLLLREEQVEGKFSIVRYYLRRTLRIWPLYFLLLLLFFLLIPWFMHWIGKDYHETANPLAYIFFWSNFYILQCGFPYSPVLAVLWTISVEEQFYVVMPWLMKFFKRWRVHVLVAVILVSTGFRIYYRDEGTVLFFNTFCIMSDFAVGALVAWLALNEHPLFLKLKKTSRRNNAFIYLLVLLMVVFYHPIFDTTIATIAERLILGIGFSYLIFDQAFGENKIFDLSRIPGFVWLGKRAYGLYCFHQIGIIISIKILIAIHLMHLPFHYLLILPVMAFILTVAMASLSYRFFEKPFLDWKKKFEMN